MGSFLINVYGNDILNSTAITPSPHVAKNMNNEQKKHVALTAFPDPRTITQIAQENGTSRKFVREQKTKVADAIDTAFRSTPAVDQVLFYLPVTKCWIAQLVLSLMLNHVSYRQISTLLSDMGDYNLSAATIHTVLNTAVEKVIFTSFGIN
jgi:hypothetical protein